MNGSTVKNHISLKTGFGYNATRRTSFRSWFQACQQIRLQDLIRQLQWHLQDRRGIFLHLPQARLLTNYSNIKWQWESREREDQSEIVSSPVPVSSSNVDYRTGEPFVCRETNHEQLQANPKFTKTLKKETTIEQGNPLFADSGRAPLSSEIPEWLQEFREKLVDDRVPEPRDSHANLLKKYLWSPHPRDVRIWVSTVFILISLKTEIARSVRGPKLQGLRVEDAKAKPYLELTILVTW